MIKVFTCVLNTQQIRYINKRNHLFVRQMTQRFNLDEFDLLADAPVAVDWEYEAYIQARAAQDIAAWLPDDEELHPPSDEAMNMLDKIFTAEMRIAQMQSEIASLQLTVRSAKARLRKQAKASESKRPRGRPARNASCPGEETPTEKAAKGFLQMWVKSVQSALESPTGAGLEQMMPSTDQRNWRRWLNGDAIPTANSFMRTSQAKIAHGKHAGKRLIHLETNPTTRDLYVLLCSV